MMTKKEIKIMREIQGLVSTDVGDHPISKQCAKGYIHSLLCHVPGKELQKLAYGDIVNAINDWVERIKE